MIIEKDAGLAVLFIIFFPKNFSTRFCKNILNYPHWAYPPIANRFGILYNVFSYLRLFQNGYNLACLINSGNSNTFCTSLGLNKNG